MGDGRRADILWAANRLPVTILLDDPTPCRNPMWYEFPDAGHVAEIPNAFVERFADMIERTGAAGKFSVVPCPGAQGRIDEGVPGVATEELLTFLRIVRERIAPRWDISPEMLTHNRALDLPTMRPLPEREDAWATHQDEATLTAYIGAALQILGNAGLSPNGVTSPWAFGREVEEAYRNAIVIALRDVCRVHVGWYFLHGDGESKIVSPQVVRLNRTESASLVSLISASMNIAPGRDDFAWQTQYGKPALIDALLTPDGTGGRLADLYANGSALMFHTHWQSLFSNGSGAGLAALETLIERINRTWGKQVRWTPARELARYSTARAATQVRVSPDAMRITFVAPFACPEFAIAAPIPARGQHLTADGVPLEEVALHDLRDETWARRDGRAIVCLDLCDGLELRWQ